MGKHQAYSKYKDSGIEWLGDVPSTWTVCRLGDFALKIGSGKTPRGGSEIYRDDGVLFLRSQNIYDDGLRIEMSESVYIAEQVDEEMANTRVQSGDILLNITGGSIGRTCIVPESFPPANVNQHVCIIRLPERLRNFISYFMKSSPLKEQIDFLQNGGNREGLNFEQIRKFSTVIPTEDELDKIANFLDHETAKIDTLIEQQQLLIQLLKEKRQAVISHAVTKGLNPNAPMKDSGVDWLGEVPAHWELKKFKHLFKIKKRIAGVLGFDVLSITQKGIKVKDIESGDGQLSMDYSKYQIVEIGDYAMNHMDLLTGFVDLSEYEGVTSPDYRVFTLEDNQSSKNYYLYLLQMGYLNRLFYPLGQGAATIGRWRLPTEAFNEFIAPCPPEKEQYLISDYIKDTLVQMSKIELEAQKAIVLMQERRTALISAAVTGKIDVRNWQAPQQ